MSWILEGLSFLKLDRKTLTTYVLVGGAIVAMYLGWRYVSANAAAKDAATAQTNQQTAEANATAHVLAGQEQDAVLSQSLSELYPATAGTVTNSSMGVGTVSPVSSTLGGSVTGSPVNATHASGGFLGGESPLVIIQP